MKDIKSTLEKTEAAIMYGQSIDTGNTGHTRHRMKTNKTQLNTGNKKDEQQGPHMLQVLLKNMFIRLILTKNNLCVFCSEIIEPIESKLVGLQLCIVID